VGTTRLLLAIARAALGVWLASGLCGNRLGVVESFFPGDF